EMLGEREKEMRILLLDYMRERLLRRNPRSARKIDESDVPVFPPMAIAAYQDPAAQTADLRKKLADTHQDVASLRLENAMLTESTQDLGAKVRRFDAISKVARLSQPPIEAHEELTAELSKLLDCKGDILPAVARVLEEVESLRQEREALIDAADAAKEARQRLAEERDRLKEALEGEVGKNNQLQCIIEDLERAVAELNDRERKANQLLQATEAHVKAVETENTRLEKEKEEMEKDQEVTTVCCLLFPLYLYIAVCSLSLSQRQRDELRRLTEVSVLLMFGYLLLLIPPQELDAARTKCQELESDNARVSEQLSATSAERNGFENELKTSIRANEEQQTSFRRWKTNLEGQLNALRNENSSLKTLVREKVANAASEEEQALLQLQEMLRQLQEAHDKLQSQC
ncbi:unnamed protein product, partial [Symbiodinium sp. KB8]